jgi:hypothetical protein
MANYNNPILDTLATDGEVVNKNEYRGNAQKIPFFIDNGVALLNSGDTITLTEVLPADTVAVSVHLKTTGVLVGSASTLTFSAGGVDISDAIDIGAADSAAIDKAYLLELPGEAIAEIGANSIIATVGTADWDNGANDLWGYIEIVTGQ